MITNDDKTLEIISEEEIERYNNMIRNEMIIPFSTLEYTLKILESLGCGYHDIRLISVSKIGKFGIKLKEGQNK
jgi:hypothetical protein